MRAAAMRLVRAAATCSGDAIELQALLRTLALALALTLTLALAWSEETP